MKMAINGTAFEFPYMVSDNQLKTSALLNFIFGTVCLVGFIGFRGTLRSVGGVYQRRRELSDLFLQPPALLLRGAARCCSWATAALRLSDADLVRSAGFDALMLNRCILMGLHMFSVLTALSLGILLPTYYSFDDVVSHRLHRGTNVAQLSRATLSNLPPGHAILWLPAGAVVGVVGYCGWVLLVHCHSYAELRMAYMLCLDAAGTQPRGQQQEQGGLADSCDSISSGGGGDDDSSHQGKKKGKEEESKKRSSGSTSLHAGGSGSAAVADMVGVVCRGGEGSANSAPVAVHTRTLPLRRSFPSSGALQGAAAGSGAPPLPPPPPPPPATTSPAAASLPTSPRSTTPGSPATTSTTSHLFHHPRHPHHSPRRHRRNHSTLEPSPDPQLQLPQPSSASSLRYSRSAQCLQALTAAASASALASGAPVTVSVGPTTHHRAAGALSYNPATTAAAVVGSGAAFVVASAAAVATPSPRRRAAMQALHAGAVMSGGGDLGRGRGQQVRAGTPRGDSSSSWAQPQRSGGQLDAAPGGCGETNSRPTEQLDPNAGLGPNFCFGLDTGLGLALEPGADPEQGPPLGLRLRLRLAAPWLRHVVVGAAERAARHKAADNLVAWVNPLRMLAKDREDWARQQLAADQDPDPQLPPPSSGHPPAATAAHGGVRVAAEDVLMALTGRAADVTDPWVTGGPTPAGRGAVGGGGGGSSGGGGGERVRWSDSVRGLVESLGLSLGGEEAGHGHRETAGSAATGLDAKPGWGSSGRNEAGRGTGTSPPCTSGAGVSAASPAGLRSQAPHEAPAVYRYWAPEAEQRCFNRVLRHRRRQQRQQQQEEEEGESPLAALHAGSEPPLPSCFHSHLNPMYGLAASRETTPGCSGGGGGRGGSNGGGYEVRSLGAAAEGLVVGGQVGLRRIDPWVSDTSRSPHRSSPVKGMFDGAVDGCSSDGVTPAGRLRAVGCESVGLGGAATSWSAVPGTLREERLGGDGGGDTSCSGQAGDSSDGESPSSDGEGGGCERPWTDCQQQPLVVGRCNARLRQLLKVRHGGRSHLVNCHHYAVLVRDVVLRPLERFNALGLPVMLTAASPPPQSPRTMTTTTEGDGDENAAAAAARCVVATEVDVEQGGGARGGMGAPRRFGFGCGAAAEEEGEKAEQEAEVDEHDPLLAALGDSAVGVSSSSGGGGFRKYDIGRRCRRRSDMPLRDRAVHLIHEVRRQGVHGGGGGAGGGSQHPSTRREEVQMTSANGAAARVGRRNGFNEEAGMAEDATLADEDNNEGRPLLGPFASPAGRRQAAAAAATTTTSCCCCTPGVTSLGDVATGTTPNAAFTGAGACLGQVPSPPSCMELPYDDSEEAAAVAAYYSQLFPDSFQRLVPVCNHRAVDELLFQWTAAMEQLAAALLAANMAARTAVPPAPPSSLHSHNPLIPAGATTTSTTTTMLPTPSQQLPAPADLPPASSCSSSHHQVAAVRRAAAAVLQLQRRIAEERCRTLQRPSRRAYVALFSSQRDAAAAAQCSPLAPPSRAQPLHFRACAAPPPDSVYWPALWTLPTGRAARLLASAPLLAVLAFPIGALTGALANLPVAVCGGTPQLNRLYWPWFCSSMQAEEGGGHPAGLLGRLAKSALTGLLPALLSLGWNAWVLPMALYLLAAIQSRCVSLPSLDRQMSRWFFWWSLLNMFLGAVVGGGLFQQLGAYLQDPGRVLLRIGTALPTASNFFLHYTLTKGLYSNWLRIAWPHLGCMAGAAARGLAGAALPRSWQDVFRIHSPPGYRFSSFYNGILQTHMVGLAYVVTAPLIAPIALLYFATAYLTWRYAAVYVYERQYESGGQMFPVLFDHLVGCLLVAELFSGAVLLTNGGWVQAVLLWAALTPALLAFRRVCVRRYIRPLEHPPMSLAMCAPPACVDPAVYLPPALREGSLGWYPESGKVWEQYGIPKYVI
ncbi:hypothetical protein Agub_g9134 [Astrephomene gubernaculifera]|uniref:CSC1/OSCA1-like 7TM region domain-containing protein n=1 Tax=Astrephomene gubernaculifera TaxID=47775 RepID=A0AAD3DUP5_9CHLO|nr:hypothetical protein Agub_g9134 [Astrephomene gubernaculifera]